VLGLPGLGKGSGGNGDDDEEKPDNPQMDARVEVRDDGDLQDAGDSDKEASRGDDAWYFSPLPTLFFRF
jgi:hypothetical protein